MVQAEKYRSKKLEKNLFLTSLPFLILSFDASNIRIRSPLISPLQTLVFDSTRAHVIRFKNVHLFS